MVEAAMSRTQKTDELLGGSCKRDLDRLASGRAVDNKADNRKQYIDLGSSDRDNSVQRLREDMDRVSRQGLQKVQSAALRPHNISDYRSLGSASNATGHRNNVHKVDLVSEDNASLQQ